MTIRRWDATTGALLGVLEHHRERVVCLLIVGHFLISGSEDKTLRQWDLKAGQLLRTIDHTAPVTCILSVAGSVSVDAETPPSDVGASRPVSWRQPCLAAAETRTHPAVRPPKIRLRTYAFCAYLPHLAMSSAAAETAASRSGTLQRISCLLNWAAQM